MIGSSRGISMSDLLETVDLSMLGLGGRTACSVSNIGAGVVADLCVLLELSGNSRSSIFSLPLSGLELLPWLRDMLDKLERGE